MKTKKEIQEQINRIIDWTVEGYDNLVVKHNCMTKKQFIKQEKEKWEDLADWIKDAGAFKKPKQLKEVSFYVRKRGSKKRTKVSFLARR